MNRLFAAVQERLNLAPVVATLRDSHPRSRIPLSEAPPVSLGRLAGLLTGMLVLSGFGLLLYYEPTAVGAAPSLAALHQRRPIGWLIHNVHRWSALLLLVTVILHALRAWLARAYRPPRDLNWWVGLGLLVLTVGMGGTGYLLRWDIKAFTLMELIISSFSELPLVGPALIAAMLGGTELDLIPLYRGYAFHIWVLPILLVTLSGLHLLVAWRQGLAERPSWWERLRTRLPDLPGMALMPGAALLLALIALSALTPHAGQGSPTARSWWPHPDWLLSLYLLPFWLFGRATRALGTAVLPAALLGLLILIPRWAVHGKRWVSTGLAVLGLAGVVWLFGQIAVVGATIPSQGCTACHQPGILGGAPTELSEFRMREPDWLIYHLRQPQASILEPALPPEELP